MKKNCKQKYCEKDKKTKNEKNEKKNKKNVQEKLI